MTLDLGWKHITRQTPLAASDLNNGWVESSTTKNGWMNKRN